MVFNQVLVIGNGKIAVDCVEILVQRAITPIVLESQFSAISVLERFCEKKNLEFYKQLTSKEIFNRINSLAHKDKLLVVSANNENIFPPYICDHPNITIINFHYALLPDYRGMNIPTWVIFNGEKETGVTWHYVNSDVDAGDIIKQDTIPISSKTTAFDITKKVMMKGKMLFEDILDDVLEGIVNCKPNTGCVHMYKRAQLPNKGYITGEEPGEFIDRMLRCFDYGPLEYIPNLKLVQNGADKEIIRYRIFKNEELKVGNIRWKADECIEVDEYRFDLLFKK